jgi:hypothetical protein
MYSVGPKTAVKTYATVNRVDISVGVKDKMRALKTATASVAAAALLFSGVRLRNRSASRLDAQAAWKFSKLLFDTA